MTTKSLDDLLPYLEPHVPGCPEPMMIDALREKFRELCERSGVWRERLPKLDVYKGLADYELDVPFNMELVSLKQLYWGDRALPFRSIDIVRATDGGNDTPTSNEPDWWTMPELNIVRLYPAPDADSTDQLEPYAAVTLAIDESVFPAELMRFAHGIGAGAAGKLKMMPGQPWTDREGFQQFNRAFRVAAGEAIRWSMTSMSGQPGRASGAQFNPP